MTKLYLYTKKIHRLLVLAMIVLGSTMALTGLGLRYPGIALDLFESLDLGQVRYLHNQISFYFSIVLGLMSLTGLWMYLYPKITARRAKKKTQDQQQS